MRRLSLSLGLVVYILWSHCWSTPSNRQHDIVGARVQVARVSSGQSRNEYIFIYENIQNFPQIFYRLAGHA